MVLTDYTKVFILCIERDYGKCNCNIQSVYISASTLWVALLVWFFNLQTRYHHQKRIFKCNTQNVTENVLKDSQNTQGAKW